MFVSRANTLSIETSDVISSVSVLVTTSIVRRQQVGPSLLTMNIRKAFHKFNLLSIEILSLFTVELSYFLWRKRQFIRSQTFTIKRIHWKFLQSFISLQSVVLYAFNFRIKFRSLYKLSNCNYSYVCIVLHYFLLFTIHECVPYLPAYRIWGFYIESSELWRHLVLSLNANVEKGRRDSRRLSNSILKMEAVCCS